jgi:hypothetical protein
MDGGLRYGFGVVLGAALCRLLSLLLGVCILSASGLVLVGAVWPAVLVASVGVLLYDGGVWLVYGRPRRRHV